MGEPLQRGTLSLAAEYAVASELCRRGVYTQLTLGNLKSTDLLAFKENGGGVIKIEVKAKQGRAWPACKGIESKEAFIVFVDYRNKELDDRPDFYILSRTDWANFLRRRLALAKAKGKQVSVKSGRVTWASHMNKHGKPHVGIAVRPELIERNRESWEKIETVLK